MKEPTLVILAAGLGSRYGELKQLDPLNSLGETLIDFSVYDAIEAGFKKILMVIRREHEDAIEKAFVRKIRPFVEVEYAYQDMQDLPKPYKVPENRVKPWGTTHALLACRNILDTPFAVINTNVYYGKEAFRQMCRYLTKKITNFNYCMIGYVLDRTLSDYGPVNRGVCAVKDDHLTDILECHRIKRINQIPYYSEDGDNYYPIAPDSIVSMNFWGFTPKIMPQLSQLFEKFLETELDNNPLKCEHVLTDAVDYLVNERTINVQILYSDDTWYGTGYREDKEHLMMAIQDMKEKNLYPEALWEADLDLNQIK